VKYWEVIVDNLKQAGWNCGCISSTDQKSRQFWVAAAEREDAGRFIVRADEKLTAFLELELAIRASSRYSPEPISFSADQSQSIESFGSTAIQCARLR
jgi:hypothetical protein